jgi:tRNA (cytidine/uridine-2'-O-)-methyltransferase
LHLVKPLGFEISDRTLKRAGLDYWDKLTIFYYDSLEDFLAKNQGAKMYLLSTRGRRNYTDVKYEDGSFLIFGKETKGLPEKFVRDNFDNTLRIPMKGEVRSLNLSNSVAIVLYEALRQADFFGFDLYVD